jgi:hypothetical protein
VQALLLMKSILVTRALHLFDAGLLELVQSIVNLIHAPKLLIHLHDVLLHAILLVHSRVLTECTLREADTRQQQDSEHGRDRDLYRHHAIFLPPSMLVLAHRDGVENPNNSRLYIPSHICDGRVGT